MKKSAGFHVLLVTGGRAYDDYEAVHRTVERLVEKCESDGRTPVVISGGASGADKFARIAADELGVKFREFRADWKGLGKRAGMVRNQQMLDALIEARRRGNVVTVVAFPGGKGTAHMSTIAREAKIRVAAPSIPLQGDALDAEIVRLGGVENPELVDA